MTSKPFDDVILFPDNSLSGGSNSSSVGGATSTSTGGVNVALRSVTGDINLFPVHTSDGNATKILKGHLGAVTATVYRKPYQQVVSAGRDNMMFVWDSSKYLTEKNRRVVGDNGRFHTNASENTTANATSSSSGRVLNKRQFTGYSFETDVQQGITNFTATRDTSTTHRASNRPHVVDSLNVSASRLGGYVAVDNVNGEEDDVDTWSLPGDDDEVAEGRNQAVDNLSDGESGEILWDEQGNRISNHNSNHNRYSNRHSSNRLHSHNNSNSIGNKKTKSKGKAGRSALSDELRQYLSQDVLRSTTTTATAVATATATVVAGRYNKNSSSSTVSNSSSNSQRPGGQVALNTSSKTVSASPSSSLTGGGGGGRLRDVDWESVEQIFDNGTSSIHARTQTTATEVTEVTEAKNISPTVHSGISRRHVVAAVDATEGTAGNIRKKKTVDTRAVIMKQLNKRSKR